MNKNDKNGEGLKNSSSNVKPEAPINNEVSTPKMRQVVIETDGNNIQIVKAEVGGKIELIGILQSLIAFLNQQK